MIEPISYENIVKTMRNTLIKYTNVKAVNILNALSARGTNLSEIINETKTSSFAMSDVVILFELLRSQEGNNFATTKDDNAMLVINSYQFHIMIYGNGSDACMQHIKAIFKQPDIAMNLRGEGIHITGVTEGESINEFLNNSLYLRHDITILFETRSDFDNIIGDEVDYFSYANTFKAPVDIIIKKV